MTLAELTSIHEVDVYPLSQTRDAMAGTVESLGTRSATGVKCRVVPLPAKERRAMEQRQLLVTHQVQFSSNPSLTLQTALVYNDQVLHVREITNRDGLGWSWIAMCEHMPQVEIGAP